MKLKFRSAMVSPEKSCSFGHSCSRKKWSRHRIHEARSLRATMHSAARDDLEGVLLVVFVYESSVMSPIALLPE